MATQKMQLNMSMTYLRANSASNGRAMPIDLRKACIGGGIGICDSPFFAVAHGHLVPISWESPPTLLE
ncbi:MAG: hypothetical protein NVS4B7_10830 [Ktedonobacteraceae bacterium]